MAIKSPFPGMDPYLEQHWGDIHHSLIQYARDQLQQQLPDALRARVEERVFLESSDGWARKIVPDVRIVERNDPDDWRGGATGELSHGGVAVAEPLVVKLPNDSFTEGFIEIRDTSSGNKVITVIEFLSLANKAGGGGTDEYLRKQREVLSGYTSLVEIDLLRGGRRVTAVPAAALPPSHRTPYHVCVHRGWRGDEFEIYRIPIRERLPIIPVPLRKTDRDATLDLQGLIELAYRMGRYDDIDYRNDPNPPMSAEDAAWVRETLGSGKL